MQTGFFSFGRSSLTERQKVMKKTTENCFAIFLMLGSKGNYLPLYISMHINNKMSCDNTT